MHIPTISEDEAHVQIRELTIRWYFGEAGIEDTKKNVLDSADILMSMAPKESSKYLLSFFLNFLSFPLDQCREVHVPEAVLLGVRCWKEGHKPTSLYCYDALIDLVGMGRFIEKD